MKSKVERFAASFYGILRRDPFLKFEKGRLRRLARVIIRRLEPSEEEMRDIREITGDWVPAFSDKDRETMVEQLREDLENYGGTCDNVEGVIDDFLKNVFPNIDVDYINCRELAREIFIHYYEKFYPGTTLPEGTSLADLKAMQRELYIARRWSRTLIFSHLVMTSVAVVARRYGDRLKEGFEYAVVFGNDFKSFYPEIKELYAKANKATLAEAKRFHIEFEARYHNFAEIAARLEKITPELRVEEEDFEKGPAPGAKRKRN